MSKIRINMDINSSIFIVEVIIRWAEIAKSSKKIQYADNGTTFSIPYDDFSINGKRITAPILKGILYKLQDLGAFEYWEVNPYKPERSAVLVFRRVNISNLVNYKSQLEGETQAKVSKPSYKSGKLFFMDKDIYIPSNSLEDELCKVLFKNLQTMQIEWNWDQIVEAWGELIDYNHPQWRKIYSASRRVNSKVASETRIKDLLIATTKTVKVNPKYISS